MNCPNCGKELNTEVCECGFNFNLYLTCPYIMSEKCIHTNKECKIYGLCFEDCEIYLHKSGIEV